MKNYKILIIEDEKFLLDLYNDRFKKEGLDVITVRNGSLALKTALEERPDLVLLDIVMPGLNGWEVLKALKTDEQTKNIPVLIFSNLSQPEEIERGLNLGADDYVTKTEVTPTELLDKVKRMLASRSQSKSKKRILIIADKPQDIKYLIPLQEKFETEITSNIKEGLRFAPLGDFNLILFDFDIIDSALLENIRSFKKNFRLKNIPIALVASQKSGEPLDFEIKDFFIKTEYLPEQIAEKIKQYV